MLATARHWNQVILHYKIIFSPWWSEVLFIQPSSLSVCQVPAPSLVSHLDELSSVIMLPTHIVLLFSLSFMCHPSEQNHCKVLNSMVHASFLSQKEKKMAHITWKNKQRQRQEIVSRNSSALNALWKTFKAKKLNNLNTENYIKTTVMDLTPIK